MTTVGSAASGASTPVEAAVPGWQPLALAHADRIESVLAGWRRHLGRDALSEYSFANLYLFRGVHHYHWRGGAWPALRGLTYDGCSHVLPLFEIGTAPAAVLQELLGQADCLFPLPARQAARLGPAFASEALEADADYLYSADNFRLLRGPALRKKRAQLQRLVAEAGPPTCAPLDAGAVPQALAVLAGWLADRGKSEDDADAGPCREALALRELLGLQGRLYSVGGEAAGFLLTESLAPGVRVVRFAKALDRHPGLYPFMFQDLCLADPALDWVNFEQDLGLPNFRQAKRAYSPWALLGKHRLRFAT